MHPNRWTGWKGRLSFLLGVWMLAPFLAAAQNPSPLLLVIFRTESVLAFIDPASGQLLERVPVGKAPHEVELSTDQKLAFVCSPTDGTISMIDVAARKELRRVEIGKQSRAHGLLYADGKLYFTAEGYRIIGRYDPAADKIDWLLGVGQEGSHVLTMTKDRKRLYTTNGDSDSVSLVEGAADGLRVNNEVVETGQRGRKGTQSNRLEERPIGCSIERCGP